MNPLNQFSPFAQRSPEELQQEARNKFAETLAAKLGLPIPGEENPMPPVTPSLGAPAEPLPMLPPQMVVPQGPPPMPEKRMRCIIEAEAYALHMLNGGLDQDEEISVETIHGVKVLCRIQILVKTPSGYTVPPSKLVCYCSSCGLYDVTSFVCAHYACRKQLCTGCGTLEYRWDSSYYLCREHLAQLRALKIREADLIEPVRAPKPMRKPRRISIGNSSYPLLAPPALPSLTPAEGMPDTDDDADLESESDEL